MSDKIGLFTGSFDPITNGHLDLIERASKLFDRLYVGIFYNPHKNGFLPIESRLETVEKAVGHLKNVQVIASHDELVVDVARKLGVHVLVRGLRNAADLQYEASFDTTTNEQERLRQSISIVAQSMFTSALQL